jgi:hypothetical protein
MCTVTIWQETVSALVCGHVYHAICLDSYCEARQIQLQNLPCPICKRTAAEDVESSMPDLDPPEDMDFVDDFDPTLLNVDSDGATLERDSPMSDDDEDAVPPGQPSPKALAKAKGKAQAKAKATPKGSAAPKADPSGKAKAKAKGSAAPKADPSGKAKAKAKGKAAAKADPSAEPSASAKPKAKQTAKAKAKASAASAASAADSSAGDAAVETTLAAAPPAGEGAIAAAPPAGEIGSGQLAAVCGEGDVQCHQCRRWVPFQKVRLISKKAGLFRCSSCGATATQLRRKFGTWPTDEFLMLTEACSFRFRALLPQVQRSPALVCEHALPKFSGPLLSFPLPTMHITWSAAHRSS